MEVNLSLLFSLLLYSAFGENLTGKVAELKQQEQSELPACPVGYFFCTYHKLDCCSKRDEYCSLYSKACEKVKFTKGINEQCCDFLGDWSKYDMRYEVGTMEEGRLQVCLYNLGLLSWNTTCSKTRAPTKSTPTPENTRVVDVAGIESAIELNMKLIIAFGAVIVAVLIIVIIQLVLSLFFHIKTKRSASHATARPTHDSPHETPNHETSLNTQMDSAGTPSVNDINLSETRNRNPNTPGIASDLSAPLMPQNDSNGLEDKRS